MSIFDEIGQNIVLLRKARNITQEQLALTAEMSVSFLRTIEHGTANPSVETLNRLADVLNVDVQVLVLASLSEEDIRDIMNEMQEILGPAAERTALPRVGARSAG